MNLEQEEQAIMSLLLSIPVEHVLEQVLAGTLRLTWDWVTQAFSPDNPAGPAQATSTAENTAAADFLHVDHYPAENIAASDIITVDKKKFVEMQQQFVNLVMLGDTTIRKQAALLTRQRMHAEFAHKYRHTFELISYKNMVRNLVPPDQSAQPPRKGHKSGHGSRWKRKLKRKHAFRQANGGQQEHGSNMVRNLVPPAQSNEPPRQGHQCGNASRYRRKMQRGSLPRQQVFNQDGNWPPADHSFSMGECLKLYRPPPLRRSEHIISSTPSPAEMPSQDSLFCLPSKVREMLYLSRTSQETLTSSRTWNSPAWNSYEHSY